MNVVYGHGPTAPGTLVILGEAPGQEELVEGRPFVGPAGQALRKRLTSAGIPPESVRFENVSQTFRKPSEFYISGDLLTDEGQKLFADARKRVASIKPRVVVAAGDFALHCLTGQRGISKLHCLVLRGIQELSDTYVVPVFHPAFCLRQPEYFSWLLFGLRKAKQLLDGAKPSCPYLIIRPTLQDALSYLREAMHSPHVAIDLELFKSNITCFSLSTSPKHAISIPLVASGQDYWDFDSELAIWQALQKLLTSPVNKIFQNYIFDCMWLVKHGLEINSPLEDTLLNAHILAPELKKDLTTLARLYTLHGPWKSIKDWSGFTNPEDLWLYNALDAAITMEVYKNQLPQLQAFPYIYNQLLKPLLPRVLQTCMTGILIDKEGLKTFRTQLEAELSELRTKIQNHVESFGIADFNPNSHKQVKEALQAMKIRIPTKKGKQTTDRLAMKKLRKKFPDNPFLSNMLLYSEKQKLYSTYSNLKLDKDGRFRFTYKIGGTVSGRFASSETPWGTGQSVQTIPKTARKFFIADPGHILVQVDLKQAEARVVAWLAREENLLRIFEQGGDIHTRVASMIFGFDIKTLSKEEFSRHRYLGKKCVHAFNYGMAEQTFIDSCLKEAELVISYDEAVQLRTRYLRTFSRINSWHREVEDQVRRFRSLTNPFGRRRFFHGRLTDDVFREAYSYLPQSTVVDYLNSIWVKVPSNITVLNQNHDSLLFQVKDSERAKSIETICALFDSQRVRINGIDRFIPYDISIGKNWKDMEEL